MQLKEKKKNENLVRSGLGCIFEVINSCLLVKKYLYYNSKLTSCYVLGREIDFCNKVLDLVTCVSSFCVLRFLCLFLYSVHGVEYAFGAHDHASTGIFEVEPKKCPGFVFRKSILIGRTDLGPKEVRAFMEKLAEDYSGNTYHLITKNCNHFCNDVCLRLTERTIPRWVNRLARLGNNSFFSYQLFHCIPTIIFC